MEELIRKAIFKKGIIQEFFGIVKEDPEGTGAEII